MLIDGALIVPTIQHMHGDTFAFGIGRIASILSRIRGPGALD